VVLLKRIRHRRCSKNTTRIWYKVLLFYKNRQRETPVFLLVYLFLWWPFVGALRSMPPTLSEKKSPFSPFLEWPAKSRRSHRHFSVNEQRWSWKQFSRWRHLNTKSFFFTLEIESNIKRFIYSISVWLSNNRESTLCPCPRRRFTVRF